MPLKDKELRKEYQKEYNQRTEVKERRKEYNQRPEVKEYRKEYYQRPEVKERKSEYYKEYNQRPENKECRREYNQRPEVMERKREYNKRPEVKERLRQRKDNFERPYFSHAFKRAKKRAREKFPDKLFNITIDYLEEIFPHKDRRCPVLNIQFKRNSRGKGPTSNSPSLDRIDNDKGYEIGNMVWVCDRVNTIKSNSTPNEIIKIGEFYKKLLEERS